MSRNGCSALHGVNLNKKNSSVDCVQKMFLLSAYNYLFCLEWQKVFIQFQVISQCVLSFSQQYTKSLIFECFLIWYIVYLVTNNFLCLHYNSQLQTLIWIKIYLILIVRFFEEITIKVRINKNKISINKKSCWSCCEVKQ